MAQDSSTSISEALSTPNPLRGYGIAVLSVALAVLVRWLLSPVLGDRGGYILYLPAVIFSVWAGGIGPGVTTILLSILLVNFFILPPHWAFNAYTIQSATAVVLYTIIGLLLVAVTDSERRSRTALQQSKEYLATTLTSVGDAVIATDTAGKVRFLNPIAELLTGWTQAEAMGQELDTVFRIVREDTREPVESPVTKVLRDGVIVGLTNHTLLRTRAGTEIPIDDSGAPIRDAKGHLTGVVLIFRDITQKRQAQRALEESEERFPYRHRSHAADGLDGAF